jgi:hypothetical protein
MNKDDGFGRSPTGPDWLRDNLTRQERTAFLALFAGAWRCLRVFKNETTGKEQPVCFGKAECEWVPFRETWQHRFPRLGLTTFVESAPKPALGMAPGWVWTEVHIGVTEFGHNVREAFRNGLNTASSGEAGTAETTEIDSVHEHAVGASQDAQPPTGDPSNG